MPSTIKISAPWAPRASTGLLDVSRFCRRCAGVAVCRAVRSSASTPSKPSCSYKSACTVRANRLPCMRSAPVSPTKPPMPVAMLPAPSARAPMPPVATTATPTEATAKPAATVRVEFTPYHCFVSCSSCSCNISLVCSRTSHSAAAAARSRSIAPSTCNTGACVAPALGRRAAASAALRVLGYGTSSSEAKLGQNSHSSGFPSFKAFHALQT
mmetsp:Transcript_16163/g.56430  ORF Transcript_16163/g.56430 Transcript_16163/m.56430 type:complete len:212 (-) Transcript_16163:446-1081(-)